MIRQHDNGHHFYDLGSFRSRAAFISFQPPASMRSSLVIFTGSLISHGVGTICTG